MELKAKTHSVTPETDCPKARTVSPKAKTVSPNAKMNPWEAKTDPRESKADLRRAKADPPKAKAVCPKAMTGPRRMWTAPSSSSRGSASRRPGLAVLALFFFLQSPRAHLAGLDAPPAVELLDTGTSSAAPLTPEAISRRDGWIPLPEDETQHELEGDVVFSNGKLAIALRRMGRGAEVYSMGPKGPALRAELVAVAGAPAAALSSVEIVENDPGAAIVDATFRTAEGASLMLRYELRVGQVFVETRSRAGVTGLRVVAPCRFAVLPDFFADDIVVDATSISAPETELPTENFLLHLAGEGEAIVMAVWYPARDDVRITLSGRDEARTISGSEIRYELDGKDGNDANEGEHGKEGTEAKEAQHGRREREGNGGKVCVAVIDGPGTWHVRDVARDDAGRVIRLDWKAPYAAQWRVDWRRDDGLTDSWEMLTQSPDGEYVKHGWYGQPESFGNDDWLKPGRNRWTTVLGSFLYPCWIDRSGAGHLQPLKRGVRFLGPAIVYPIGRLEATPLVEFTVVDVLRATLGVGPCEYILDVEGQKKRFEGRPTCASRSILDGIYSRKEQKRKRDEVQKTLDEVLAFVRHIRGRIEDYVAFGHEIAAYLEEERRSQPELAGILGELQDMTRRIDGYVARRKEAIQTPEYAAKLVEEFRLTLVDYEGDDAAERCGRITERLVQIGGNQDELVGECRMVVKTLRQRVTMAAATDPRLAATAREVRRRTHDMLRNPTSYEAPRH